jgi:hypothetical protein
MYLRLIISLTMRRLNLKMERNLVQRDRPAIPRQESVNPHYLHLVQRDRSAIHRQESVSFLLLISIIIRYQQLRVIA